MFGRGIVTSCQGKTTRKPWDECEFCRNTANRPESKNLKSIPTKQADRNQKSLGITTRIFSHPADACAQTRSHEDPSNILNGAGKAPFRISSIVPITESSAHKIAFSRGSGVTEKRPGDLYLSQRSARRFPPVASKPLKGHTKRLRNTSIFDTRVSRR